MGKRLLGLEKSGKTLERKNSKVSLFIDHISFIFSFRTYQSTKLLKKCLGICLILHPCLSHSSLGCVLRLPDSTSQAIIQFIQLCRPQEPGDRLHVYNISEHNSDWVQTTDGALSTACFFKINFKGLSKKRVHSVIWARIRFQSADPSTQQKLTKIQSVLEG